MTRKSVLFNDRKLAGDLRTLTNQIALKWLTRYNEDKIETEEQKKLCEDILLKCLGSSLPRINEHSGPNGSAIEIKGVEIKIRKD